MEDLELKGRQIGRDVVGAVKDLMKDLLQKMLDEELELELGYSKHDYKNKKRVRSTLNI